MARTYEEWEKFATKEGFEDMATWLQYYYHEMRLSSLQIALKIQQRGGREQISRVRVRQLLAQYSIPRRPSGLHAPRPAPRALKLDQVDPSLILEMSPKEISEKFKVHETTARRFRRRLLLKEAEG